MASELTATARAAGDCRIGSLVRTHARHRRWRGRRHRRRFGRCRSVGRPSLWALGIVALEDPVTAVGWLVDAATRAALKSAGAFNVGAGDVGMPVMIWPLAALLAAVVPGPALGAEAHKVAALAVGRAGVAVAARAERAVVACDERASGAPGQGLRRRASRRGGGRGGGTHLCKQPRRSRRRRRTRRCASSR